MAYIHFKSRIVKNKNNAIAKQNHSLFFTMYSKMNSGMGMVEIKLEDIPIGMNGIRNKTRNAIGIFLIRITS